MPIPNFTRRAVIANLFRAAAYTTIGTPAIRALAQSGFSASNQHRRGVGFYTEQFRRQYRVPAISIAVSRGGRFVYDHAGGMADREHMAQAQQDTLFRIIDLSKPITAVTIFSLIENGKLRLLTKSLALQEYWVQIMESLPTSLM
jgi:CubicO group peptidase (beta-lactamase class C family)